MTAVGNDCLHDPKAVNDVRSRASAQKTGTGIWRRSYGPNLRSVCQGPNILNVHVPHNSMQAVISLEYISNTLLIMYVSTFQFGNYGINLTAVNGSRSGHKC